MKIIFLDVDGVLNSYKNVIVDGGYPWPNELEDPKKLESNLCRLSIGLVRALANNCDAHIVLHSTWRHHMTGQEFGNKHNLPVIDRTDPTIPKPASIRKWLSEHSNITNYVVIDDNDMQSDKQVFTDGYEGFGFRDYMKAMEILNG